MGVGGGGKESPVSMRPFRSILSIKAVASACLLQKGDCVLEGLLYCYKGS